MFEIVQDIECNRCHKDYKSSERGTMSIHVDHIFLSICPTCTKEVAALMGFTPENITKELALIKYAKTENNHQYDIKSGNICTKCEKRFKESEPRIRHSTASNVPSWHPECFPDTTPVPEEKQV